MTLKSFKFHLVQVPTEQVSQTFLFTYVSVNSLWRAVVPRLTVLQGSHDLSKIVINHFPVIPSASSLDHAPENATDLMFAWKPLLNLIIICPVSGEAGNLQNQQILAVFG